MTLRAMGVRYHPVASLPYEHNDRWKTDVARWWWGTQRKRVRPPFLKENKVWVIHLVMIIILISLRTLIQLLTCLLKTLCLGTKVNRVEIRQILLKLGKARFSPCFLFREKHRDMSSGKMRDRQAPLRQTTA